MKTNTIAKAVILAAAATIFPGNIIASAYSDNDASAAADVPAEMIEAEQSVTGTETAEQSETVSIENGENNKRCVTESIYDESGSYCCTITRITDEDGNEKTVTGVYKDGELISGEEPDAELFAVEGDDGEVNYSIIVDADGTAGSVMLKTLSEREDISEILTEVSEDGQSFFGIAGTGEADGDNDIQYSCFGFGDNMTVDMSGEDAAEFDRINDRINEIDMLVTGGGKVLSAEDIEAGYAAYKDELDEIYSRLDEIIEKYIGSFDFSAAGMEDDAV